MREEDRREEEEQVERRAREGIHDVECVVCGERPGFADGQILSFSRCARKRATARRIGTSPSSDPNSRAVGAARVDAKGASARSGVTGEGASRRNARANVAPGVVRRSRARGTVARGSRSRRAIRLAFGPPQIVRRPRRDARRGSCGAAAVPRRTPRAMGTPRLTVSWCVHADWVAAIHPSGARRAPPPRLPPEPCRLGDPDSRVGV